MLLPEGHLLCPGPFNRSTFKPIHMGTHLSNPFTWAQHGLTCFQHLLWNHFLLLSLWLSYWVKMYIQGHVLSDADCVKVKKAQRGDEVSKLKTHTGNLRRKYKISGLAAHPTRELIFPLDEHLHMKSVVEYFQGMYGFTIQYSNLPCLQLGDHKRKANYLSMELGATKYLQPCVYRNLWPFSQCICGLTCYSRLARELKGRDTPRG